MARKPVKAEPDQDLAELTTPNGSATRGSKRKREVSDPVRLRKVFEYSRRELEYHREERRAVVAQMVGSHYGLSGPPKDVPVNLMEQAASIYRRQIAARSPKVMVTTPWIELLASSRRLQAATNRVLEQIGFDLTSEDWVMNALTRLGIVKVGVTPEAMAGNRKGRGDRVFVGIVGLDDWVHDMSARRYSEIQFAGNRYRIPAEKLHNSRMFDVQEHEVESAASTSFHDTNEQGDERLATMSRGLLGDTYDAEFEEMVELWDFWLPSRGEIWTMLSDGRGGLAAREDPVRVVTWKGPDHGPYHMLSYNPVPDNIMPLSPLGLLRDMHELANRVYRKLERQAQRQKTVTGVQRRAKGDGSRVIEADDGKMIALDDPQSVREYRFGGIDAPMLAFFLQLKDLYYEMAGNLDVLGGLSPQSQTLGQEEILSANAGQRVSEMQEKTIRATRQVVRDVVYWLWNDPRADVPLTLPIEGTDLSIPSRFTPERRQGRLDQYAIDLHPYSMTPQTPSMRLRTLTQVMDRLVAPYLPMMQAQGMSIDFERLFDLVAEYTDMAEIRWLLGVANPIAQGNGGQSPSDRPIQSPTTRRIEERVNRSQVTRRGADRSMAAALMGAGGIANSPGP